MHKIKVKKACLPSEQVTQNFRKIWIPKILSSSWNKFKSISQILEVFSSNLWARPLWFSAPSVAVPPLCQKTIQSPMAAKTRLQEEGKTQHKCSLTFPQIVRTTAVQSVFHSNQRLSRSSSVASVSTTGLQSSSGQYIRSAFVLNTEANQQLEGCGHHLVVYRACFWGSCTHCIAVSRWRLQLCSWSVGN